jgi:hypothetical protein
MRQNSPFLVWPTLTPDKITLFVALAKIPPVCIATNLSHRRVLAR